MKHPIAVLAKRDLDRDIYSSMSQSFLLIVFWNLNWPVDTPSSINVQ